MGIHRTSLVAIEAGKRKVTSDELKNFAEIYGWTVDDLLYGKKAEENQKVLVFARNFKELTDRDQQEIINLIEFKKMMKEQKNKIKCSNLIEKDLPIWKVFNILR